MALLLSRKVAFSSVAKPVRSRVVLNVTYKVTIKSPKTGHETTFDCADNQFILEAAEAAGLDLPHSCRFGTCCTCAGKLQSGTVNQEEQNFLDDEQMGEGFALLCVSYPTSDCVVLSEQHALNPLMK